MILLSMYYLSFLTSPSGSGTFCLMYILSLCTLSDASRISFYYSRFCLSFSLTIWPASMAFVAIVVGRTCCWENALLGERVVGSRDFAGFASVLRGKDSGYNRVPDIWEVC